MHVGLSVCLCLFLFMLFNDDNKYLVQMQEPGNQRFYLLHLYPGKEYKFPQIEAIKTDKMKTIQTPNNHYVVYVVCLWLELCCYQHYYTGNVLPIQNSADTFVIVLRFSYLMFVAPTSYFLSFPISASQIVS